MIASSRVGRRPPTPDHHPSFTLKNRSVVLAILLGALPACTQHKVTSFVPDKTSVCPGETATLRWTVNGLARLKVQSQTSGWSEDGIVLSYGERSFVERETTTFTLTATQENPALGNLANETIAVVTSGPKGNNSTCNAGSCVATFTPKAGLARVSRLSAPTIKAGGHDLAANLCISHQGLPRRCLAPGEALAVDVPYDGQWTLEAALPPQPIAPILTITFDFNCPTL